MNGITVTTTITVTSEPANEHDSTINQNPSMALESFTKAELEGLWNYLFERAQNYHAANDAANAKALLKYLLRQPDVSAQHRKDAHKLLAIISYGPAENVPSSSAKLAIRSACLRSWSFVKGVVMAPIHVGIGWMASKQKQPTPSQVLEFHNQTRRERIERESGAMEREITRSYASGTLPEWGGETTTVCYAGDRDPRKMH